MMRSDPSRPYRMRSALYVVASMSVMVILSLSTNSYHIVLMCLSLNLVASHPDRTGGIGFLTEAQTKYGWVILA